MEEDEGSNQKSIFTEDEKCHNLMSSNRDILGKLGDATRMDTNENGLIFTYTMSKMHSIQIFLKHLVYITFIFHFVIMALN